MENLQFLNERQQEAVTSEDRALLVLAGAGSGKTRVVVTRILYLLSQGERPHSILGLTFTNKAAQEMKERIRQAAQVDILLGTFHSLGVRILRESGRSIGLGASFTIFDEEDSEKLLRRCLDKYGLASKKGDIKSYKSLISQCKNALKGPGDELEEESLEHFSKVYHDYAEALTANQAVDFDDLLFLPVQLLRQSPEVLTFYQQRWRHLLIDEYQDTNRAQYELVKLLVQPDNRLFAVGDPDQAIYSWRGANIRNILDFQKDFPEAKVVRLEQNYRSRMNILQAANALINCNTMRLEKRLWTERGEGAKIGRFSGYDERDEARFASKKALEHMREGIPLCEMAVFYRTNAQSRAFEDQFLAHKIPYKIVGGLSFYQRKEIKDLLAFLRLVISDHDMAAFSRSILLGKGGLGKVTLDKLLNAALERGTPIFQLCRDIVEGKAIGIKLSKPSLERLKELVNWVEGWRSEAGHLSLQDLLKKVIDDTGYLKKLSEDPESVEDRKENIDELITKTVEWDFVHEKPELSLFLEEVSLRKETESAEGEVEGIQLMTVHNGKGLEYKVVFLAGLEEDLFPHANARGSEEKLQEERRLCYVGMTRAKDYLYLTSAEVRYLWGVERFQRPSRFLKEIPPEFMIKIRLFA